MRKGFIIISWFLYFYLLLNCYIYKGKFKRAVSYTRASKALPGSPFIAVTFNILKPHLRTVGSDYLSVFKWKVVTI